MEARRRPRRRRVPASLQFTPTGSSCSVQFGANLTPAEPGSTRALLLIVSDIDASSRRSGGTRGQGRATCSTAQRGPCAGSATPVADDRASDARARAHHNSYGSYASFSDPDGNGWVLQEVTNRLPGRTDPAVTSFGSTPDLAGALRRAAAAHGQHEKLIGESDANWPDWYADYMVREQSGAELPK